MTLEAQSRQYPRFSPPCELSKSSPATWSVAEGRRYLIWLTSALDNRVANLLAYLGDSGKGDPGELLDRVGHKAVWVLRKPEFSRRTEDSIQLTEPGYSLAADLGLLVAKLLIESNPAICWKVLRRPRSEVSFNQPVLVGFGKIHLDPVRGSVAEALRALREDAGGSAWARTFEYWRGLSENR
jgi:hypothetical protein